MAKCKDCGWWKLLEDNSGQLNGSRRGHCHGRAPSVTAIVMPKVNQIANTVTPQIVEITTWPVTPGDCDACGDFKQGE